MLINLTDKWLGSCTAVLRPQTEFFYYYSAVVGGNFGSVKLILDCSPNSQPLPNLCSGDTPLLAACRKKKHDKAKLLLEYSPKLILVQNKMQDSALHIAVMHNDIQMITMLLEQVKLLLNRKEFRCENSYGLDFIDCDGNTPFYNACNKGHTKIVTMLIDFQKEFPEKLLINIDKRNGENQRTALHAAVHNKSLEIIHMLLEMGVNINRKGKPTKFTQRHLINNHLSAAHSNSYTMSDISRSAPTKSSQFSRVVPESEELLLSVDIRKSKMQMPLRSNATNVIIDEESITISDSLMQSDTQKTFYETFITPLAEACVYGSDDIVELLLKHGAHDNDGLACRICHFLSNQALTQLILSFHCVVEIDIGVNDQSEESHLMLQWEGKCLQTCNGNWLSCSATFSPKRLSESELNPIVHNADEFYQLYTHKAITVVNLSKNTLSSIPIELFCLPNVTSINLSYNKLSQLPTRGVIDLCGWCCSQLKELDVSHNCLSYIPMNVWILPNMSEICCERNNITTLSLPSIDKASQSMIRANFSQNKIKSLTESLWLLGALEELNLSNNCLTVADLNFPSRMGSKQNMPVVRNNTQQMSTHSLRSRFSHYFGGIEEFSIGFQPESDFPRYDYSSLQKLNVSNNSLAKFPEALSCIAPNLKELNISNNDFECVDIQLIPQYINKLTAANCKIKSFGNVLISGRHTFIMTNCSSIYAQTSLCEHRSHHQLQVLTELDLSGNHLTDFQILDCSASRYCLDKLAAPENRVDPRDSSHLLYPKLISLNLERNELVGCFNRNIGCQLKLKTLLLSSNHDLTHLPNELGQLNVTNLAILDTPNLVDPPLEYQNITELEHVEGVLHFLKARMKR